MIPAVIFICIFNTQQCQIHPIKVEPAACNLRQYQAQSPIDGEWKKVNVGIRCQQIRVDK